MGVGGAKQEVTKYGMSMHFGVCAQADVLLAVTIKEKLAWSGFVTTQSPFVIDKEELFGAVFKEGGVAGVVYWLPGESTQVLPDVLAQKLGRANGADCPGYRGIASIFFTGGPGTPFANYDFSNHVNGEKGFYWTANNPYLPGVWVTVRRAPVGLDPDYALIPRLNVDQFPFDTVTLDQGFGGFDISADGSTGLVWNTSGFEILDMATRASITSADWAVSAVGHSDAVLFDGYIVAHGSSSATFWSTSGALITTITLGNTVDDCIRTAHWVGLTALTAHTMAQLVRTDETLVFDVGFKPIFYGEDSDGAIWVSGTVATDIHFFKRVSDTEDSTFSVASPTGSSGLCRFLFNPDGKLFCRQGNSIFIVDPDTEAVTATGTAVGAANDEQFTTYDGAGFYWSQNHKYDTSDLSLVESYPTPSTWVTGGGADVYDRASHALFGGRTGDNDLVDWLALDAGRYDANPAHIIYEALTNTDWGMGSPSTIIDVDSFEAAGVTLYGESLGLSLIWTRQATIQDFIQEVQDHIQSVLFVDPGTGLLTLKLIRGDYDPDELEEINPSNGRLSNFSRKVWGDIANEVNVTWTNPDTEEEETVTVQDLASIAAQGGIVSDSRNYYGVRTSALAQRLAQRELRSAGAPLAGCEAFVDRSRYLARPASVYKLTWPEHGVSGIVMRVVEVDYGKPGDSRIALTLLEDVYGLDVGEYIEPPETLWEDTSSPPAPLEFEEVLTLPAYMVQTSTVDASAAAYPEVLAGVLGSTDDEDAADFELWTQLVTNTGGTEWDSIGTKGIAGHGELASGLDAEASSSGVAFNALVGKVSPVTGTFAIIGDGTEEENEIALVTASGFTLSRGVLDTVPRAWPAGTPVWFIDDESLFEDTTVRSVGEEVLYKFRTRTSLGLLSLEAAPIIEYELTARPWLPNRPANVEIDSVQFNTVATPVDMIGETEVPVIWANRNRLLESGQVLAWTDSDVTPEVGQTTTITIYAADETTVLDTITALMGTSHNIPVASFAGVALALVVLTASRTDDDGTFESLQGHGIWVQVEEGFGARFTETDDLRVAEDGEPRLTEG